MSTGGLYNADGNFVPFSSAELSTELATRQNAGVLFGELDGWLSPYCANAETMRRSCGNFRRTTR